MKTSLRRYFKRLPRIRTRISQLQLLANVTGELPVNGVEFNNTGMDRLTRCFADVEEKIPGEMSAYDAIGF